MTYIEQNPLDQGLRNHLDVHTMYVERIDPMPVHLCKG
jgi:hypothetical protein